MPDLQITSVTYTPYESGGQAVYDISVDVENIGTAGCGNTGTVVDQNYHIAYTLWFHGSISMYMDYYDTTTDTSYLSGGMDTDLNGHFGRLHQYAGETVTEVASGPREVYINDLHYPLGWTDYMVCADYNNDISEGNENNNCLGSGFQIVGTTANGQTTSTRAIYNPTGARIDYYVDNAAPGLGWGVSYPGGHEVHVDPGHFANYEVEVTAPSEITEWPTINFVLDIADENYLDSSFDMTMEQQH